MPPSTCREFIGAAVLARGGLLSIEEELALPQGVAAVPQTPNGGITVVWDGLRIDGRLWPIYGGSFHYWRHDCGLWPGLFDNIASLGLQTNTTYIPWAVHETERGKSDFGQIDPRKDVAAFLKVAQSKGFKVIVRLGHTSIPN